MNAIKINLDNKLEGAETKREQNQKLNNYRKLYNFPGSPINKNIKSINFGNIKASPVPKYIQKENSSEKLLIENIKKYKKQNSTNDLNVSNHNCSNSNHQKKKDVKNIELTEKDINNFKDFKKINQLNNDIPFRKDIINNRIKSILCKNNNINISDLVLKSKQNLFNKIDNSNTRIIGGGEISYLKSKKINEKIKFSNKNNRDKISKIVDNKEINRIKTPTKKLFIESDRENVKESLSEYIKFDNQFLQLKGNTTTKINGVKNDKFIPEENHFKAVIYSQNIKKLNDNLE